MSEVKQINASYTKSQCQHFASCTGWHSGPCQRLSLKSADCKSFNYFQGITCEWIDTWTLHRGTYHGRKGSASCS
jgi:hypothetical protein